MNTILPLKNILLSFATNKGNKRLLFNSGAIGGINTNLVKVFLFSLPFLEYAAIFNPYMFNKLGIATAVVAYIVFSSFMMFIVFGVFWTIKKNVLKAIDSSWKHYFPGKDLHLVLASGVTPYKDFFKYYKESLEQNLNEDEMKQHLLKAFKTMEEENQDLITAMNRNNKLEKSS